MIHVLLKKFTAGLAPAEADRGADITKWNLWFGARIDVPAVRLRRVEKSTPERHLLAHKPGGDTVLPRKRTLAA